jgi:hypothetical protein
MSEDFIGKWYMKDPSVCDGLINYHKENTDEKIVGCSMSADNIISIDKNVKDSIDVMVMPQSVNSVIRQYIDHLQKCCFNYLEKYKTLGTVDIQEKMNIQYYPLNGGYKVWHAERTSGSIPIVSRALVFMTYLNDVNDEGETEFRYFNKKIKPEKGLTLIWPPDFTHTHRGIPSPSQEKYIITGWFSFI